MRIFCLTIIFNFILFANLFAFEDTRYDIKCDFDPKAKTINAQENITFKNNANQAIKEIYFRIYPNHKFSKKEINSIYKYSSYLKINPFPGGFDPGDFQIKSISQNDKELDYQIEGQDQTVLKVILKEPLKAGDFVELNIDFYLKIPQRYGRFGWHNNIFALNRWYPILSVFDQEGWHNDPDYIFQLPYFSEAAIYRVELTLPNEYSAVFGGELKREKINLDNSKTLIIESDPPLREFSLALSSEYKKFTLTDKDITINSFYLKGDEFSAQKAAEFALSMIKYYSEKFGEYPYNQFSIAPVYLGYGGNQCSGMIFVDTRFYRLPKFLIRYLDNLIAHETGHQWWYNIVGNNKYKEIWLDEGINVYWLLRYVKNKYGKDAEIFDFPKWLDFFIPNLYFERMRFSRYYYLVKNGLASAVVNELAGFNNSLDIFAIAYGKGSGVIHMLEGLVGEERLLSIMRSYFNKFYFKNAKVKDFIQIANQVSGQDLNWFFDQWLYTKEACDYKVKKVSKDKIVIQKAGDIEMPLETKLEFESGKEIIDSWDGKDKTKTINIPKDEKLKSAYVDFQNKILDYDKVNNHFPRKTDIKLVPLYFGIYEVPAFLREDQYSWISGPYFSKYGFGAKSSFQKPDDYIVYISSQYNFNSKRIYSSLGFERKHLLNKQLSFGFEFLNRNARAEEDDDLNSYKIFLRKELKSTNYSFFEVNNHVGLYLVHNQIFGDHLRYRQAKESIIGWDYYRYNAGPLPDPVTGYKINFVQEFAGHFLSGTEAFVRTSLELDKYFQILPQHIIAARIKTGGAHPRDKYLFYLGSDEELRGYDYKDVQGSSILLASFEYRFPLMNNINLPIFGNTFNLNRIQGVSFFDIGKAWFNHFNETGFKKDAGVGLRFYFNLFVPIEEFILRIDYARGLDDGEDSHIWIGINHVF